MNSFFAETVSSLPLANVLVDTFVHGGFLMWPLLGLSLITLAVIVERLFWWAAARRNRDSDRLARVYHALAHGESEEVRRLVAGSSDARLRVIGYGLEHSDTDVEVAMQVRADEEASWAHRFIDVLDTAITLAPLLGLLGTVTGISAAARHHQPHHRATDRGAIGGCAQGARNHFYARRPEAHRRNHSARNARVGVLRSESRPFAASLVNGLPSSVAASRTRSQRDLGGFDSLRTSSFNLICA